MTENILYPDWLYKDLVENLLPWQQGKEITFKEFNCTYTLHDSHWVGIFYDVAYTQNITLAIQWDDVWLPKEIKKNQSRLDDWPYLFIKLIDGGQINIVYTGKEVFLALETNKNVLNI